MKKIIIHGILLFLIFFQFCSYAQTGATFKQWGEETLTKIEQDFRIPASTLYYEDINHSGPAFAWPVGIQLHALIAAGKIAQAEAFASEVHNKYWCFVNNRWSYNAVANTCGDRYYDDNAWIAKALMELYKATNNTTYLNRAREVIAFSMSGENPTNVTPGGGIKFHEGDVSGQCICATAPTMTVNLMIYQATGIQQYLTDGQRLYNWVKANAINNYGPGYRGYENAVVTQAAMLMYRITGTASYLDDARHLGLAMETSYINWNNHALHETGQWGGHDMTNAYVELYQLDGDIVWLNIVAGYLKYLHDNCKDVNGRYPENWNDAGVAGNPALIYQASVARAYAKMGTTQGGAAKYPDPIAIFQDCNYTGWSGGFLMGRYTLTDLVYHGVRDNDVSSVKVQPGYRAIFYENDNFSGASLVKTADQSCLVNDAWNDRASSMVVEAVTPIVTVYKDCNYTGRTVNLPAGDYTLAQLQVRGVNDNDISSIGVTSGYQVLLYELDNYTGATTTVTADNSCLVTNSWNDRVTSLKVRVNCTSTAITPYIIVNGGTSTQISSATLTAGGSVKLSPQPATGGSWRWAGPNGYTATTREIIISNIQTTQGGTYVAIYTNAGGCESTQNFVITVTPGTVATVYKDCNYTGTAVGLPVGDYDMAALNARGILNDDISSLKITAGYEVVVYADYNLTGTSYSLSADDACLVDNAINDWISSLRVRTKSVTTTIQAESYSSMLGIQTETTTDTGAGLNVGWIEANDWMIYNAINFPTTGSYVLEYRVASPNAGGQLSTSLNAGGTVLGNVAVPNTGGWQTWTTVSHTANVTAGTYPIRILAVTGGWNINWLRITKTGPGRSAIPENNFTETPALFKAQGSPNPFSGNVKISVDLPVAGPTKVSVLGGLGNTIADLYEGNLSAGHYEFSFNPERLSAGLYLYSVTHNGQRITGRLIMK